MLLVPNFSQDRDLAVLEPTIFRDAAPLGQTLARGTASVEGGVLEALGVDGGLDAAGPGCVVVIAQTALEVHEVFGPTTLAVRPILPAGVAATPLTFTNQPFTLATFAAQASLVFRTILAAADLRVPGEGDASRRDASVIVNRRELAELEALGTLRLVYGAASVLAQPGGWASERSAWYARAFREAWRRAEVRMDLDGDGRADAIRRLTFTQWSRG